MTDDKTKNANQSGKSSGDEKTEDSKSEQKPIIQQVLGSDQLGKRVTGTVKDKPK